MGCPKNWTEKEFLKTGLKWGSNENNIHGLSQKRDKNNFFTFEGNDHNVPIP